LAGDARDKRSRDKYGTQHERDGDECRAHLVQASARSLSRGKASRDVALDVLNDNDRIVDDDPDRKHQPEQREHVERETECGHEQERTHEGDRDGDDGNDSGSPTLQKEDDNEHDQEDRLEDSLDDCVDGLLHEFCWVIDDRVLQA
jgi:hypothetical protein